MLIKENIAEEYKKIQDEITSSLEKLDGIAVFEEESWDRPGGGGGRSRVIQNGDLIEKGGVNFSAVYGKLPESVKKAFKTEQEDFFATGVSIVLHPHNPWVPIIHMNIRYFEMDTNSTKTLKWFGGGIDVTPHYVNSQDARIFHQHIKKVCDQAHPDFYPKFKKWADDYFYIRHREETRGIGGIFYDRLSPDNTGISWQSIFEFSKNIGQLFVPVYTQLTTENRKKTYTKTEQEWQYHRRSRYAEFNLVYDSGTKFGLETNGRIESILMSMPPMASWIYNYYPQPGSKEDETLKLLKKGIDWI